MKIVIFKIKQIISKIKPSYVKKIRRVLVKTKRYHKEVLKKIKNSNIRIIKKYSLGTWKWYGDNHVRMTYLAKIGRKKYILKATKGFERKSSNSIYFQKLFNDKFDFIPKGFDVPIDGYLVSMTEFIKSYSFKEAVSLGIVNESNVDFFLKQAADILEQLDNENIVHCDLADVNLLVEIKTNKLFVIDWDTVCSKKYNLVSDGFPHKITTRSLDNGQYVYDDAYAFYILFKSLGFKNLNHNAMFKTIENKIDKNTFVANY